MLDKGLCEHPSPPPDSATHLAIFGPTRLWLSLALVLHTNIQT